MTVSSSNVQQPFHSEMNSQTQFEISVPLFEKESTS